MGWREETWAASIHAFGDGAGVLEGAGSGPRGKGRLLAEVRYLLSMAATITDRRGDGDDGNRYRKHGVSLVSEPTVYEFKNVSVTVEVFRFDVKITITQQRGDDPIVILVSQKICADPNRLANDLEVECLS
jgi:hypothetical protein